MFKELVDEFHEEGIHREKFIISDIDQQEYKVESYMRITRMDEAAQQFFIRRYKDTAPRHQVFTRGRIIHNVYVFSNQIITDGFINFGVRRDDSLNYVFREADFHNLHT